MQDPNDPDESSSGEARQMMFRRQYEEESRRVRQPLRHLSVSPAQELRAERRR